MKSYALRVADNIAKYARIEFIQKLKAEHTMQTSPNIILITYDELDKIEKELTHNDDDRY